MEGKKAILSCESDANPPIWQYTWFDSSGQDLHSSGQKLRLEPLEIRHTGSYSCKGTNDLGTGESPPSTLTVYCKFPLLSSLGSLPCPGSCSPFPLPSPVSSSDIPCDLSGKSPALPVCLPPFLYMPISPLMDETHSSLFFVSWVLFFVFVLLYFCFSRKGFPVQSWLSQNLLYRPAGHELTAS